MENKQIEKIIDGTEQRLITLGFTNQTLLEVVRTYVIQLEKENKRIYELEKCINRLQGNKQNRESRIRNLEKENTELKEQLQAKNKALDNACECLSNVWACAHPTLKTKEDWKERCADCG